MIYATDIQTLHIFNEYFEVAVTSAAMDGAAPELNPGWVHRRKNSCLEVRPANYLEVTMHLKTLSSMRACRTTLALLFPQ